MNAKRQQVRPEISGHLGAEMLCACANLSYGQFGNVIADNPDSSFEQILDLTGSGSVCTACLLDLEFQFVTHSRNNAPATKGPAGRKPARAETRSLKRQVFDLLDRLSPSVSCRLTDQSPVLSGHGIEQRIWIANQGLLFGSEATGVPMSVRIWVRDSEGREVHSDQFVVSAGDSMSLVVSQFLPDAQQDHQTGLGIGSVEMVRGFLKQGKRGATRPHLEILTPFASCVLHTQASVGKGERWWRYQCRPDEQRMLFSIVNQENRSLDVNFQYSPRQVRGEANVPLSFEVSVPPRGSRIHEALFPDDIRNHWSDHPIDVRVRANGRQKIHAICGSPMLDRFSIDHF